LHVENLPGGMYPTEPFSAIDKNSDKVSFLEGVAVVSQVDSSKISKISHRRCYGATQSLTFQFQNHDSFTGGAACNTKPISEMGGVIPQAHDLKWVFTNLILEVEQRQAVRLICQSENSGRFQTWAHKQKKYSVEEYEQNPLGIETRVLHLVSHLKILKSSNESWKGNKFFRLGEKSCRCESTKWCKAKCEKCEKFSPSLWTDGWTHSFSNYCGVKLYERPHNNLKIIKVAKADRDHIIYLFIFI